MSVWVEGEVMVVVMMMMMMAWVGLRWVEMEWPVGSIPVLVSALGWFY